MAFADSQSDQQTVLCGGNRRLISDILEIVLPFSIYLLLHRFPNCFAISLDSIEMGLENLR